MVNVQIQDIRNTQVENTWLKTFHLSANSPSKIAFLIMENICDYTI